MRSYKQVEYEAYTKRPETIISKNNPVTSFFTQLINNSSFLTYGKENTKDKRIQKKLAYILATHKYAREIFSN